MILWNVGAPIRAKQLSMAATAGDDMVVRMRKVLAIPRSSYVCFGALTGIKPMYPILFSLLWDSSVRDGQLEKLWEGLANSSATRARLQRHTVSPASD